MKTRAVIFSLFLFTNIFSQTTVLPQFSELNGMDDQEGNTHLFYRIRSDTIIGQSYLSLKNDVYKLNISDGEDSLFFYDRVIGDENGTDFHHVNDYDFWNSDVNKYISGGTSGNFYPYTYINRFDYLDPLFYQWQGRVDNLSISKQNDSLIYVGCWASDFTGQDPFRTSKSTDGGYNWQTVSDSMEFIEVMPDDDQTFFCFNNNDYTFNYDGRLYKSSNGGTDFYLVDTLKFDSDSGNSNFLFDKNHSYVYRVFKTYNNYVLSISSNWGDPFTWETKFNSGSKIFLSVDDSVSGTIYLANKKQIYLSTDYGNSFSLYRALERNIVGIYKKPNSDKLYAATKYRIYEITTDTINVIKSLPIPEETFSWFPLDIGNKWVYYNSFHDDLGDSVRWNSTSEVVDNKVINDHVYSEVLVKEIPIDDSSYSRTRYQYFRIDSSEGKVYSADIENDSLLNEQLYMDLLAEVGDTIPIDNGIYFESEVPFIQFNLDSRKRTLSGVSTPLLYIEIVKGLGLVYWYMWELGEGKKVLRGCKIDGIVYGDTSVVTDVDNPHSNVYRYKLEQNYPNPFNPTTKIKYSISNVGASLMKPVRLKVYDILGKEVATLVNEYKPAGSYEIEFDASSIPSGVYFYQLKAGDFIQTNKMLLIK